MTPHSSPARRARNPLLLLRALRILWQAAPGWTVLNAVLVFVQGVLPLLSLFLLKQVVDAVASGIGSGDTAAAFARAALWIALLAAAGLALTICGQAAGTVQEIQGLAVTDRIYDILHAKSVEADLAYYENSEYFDTLHRAQQEAPFRPARIVSGFVKVGRSAVALAAVAGLLLSFDVLLAAGLFLAALPGVILRLKFAGTFFRWQRAQTPAERKSWYIHWVLTGDVHAKEIRLFGLGPHFSRTFRLLRRSLRGERIAFGLRRSAADLAGQSFALLAVFGALALVAKRTVAGALTLGGLAMYFQAFQRGQGFLTDLLGGLADLYEDNLFLSYLYDFLDLKPRIQAPLEPRPLPEKPAQGIAFNGVGFRYPGAKAPALQEVSLVLEPGRVAAFVGENGSGKTTLVKLLCRLYDPQEGCITWDGVDIREFDPEAYRRRISVVFQDYARYHATARENILFGDISAPQGENRIETAARDAGAHEVVGRLSRGYDTMLGKWFEDGEELSAGEWQKMALARAFWREAPIIALDEPTASLDAQAEGDLFERFRRLAKGRTAVVISHRFSTVRMADRIHVLDGGRIIESGSHEELVKSGGRYARLFDLQARNYR